MRDREHASVSALGKEEADAKSLQCCAQHLGQLCQQVPGTMSCTVGLKVGKLRTAGMKAVFKELRIKPYLDHQHIIKAVSKMKRRDRLSSISEP